MGVNAHYGTPPIPPIRAACRAVRPPVPRRPWRRGWWISRLARHRRLGAAARVVLRHLGDPDQFWGISASTGRCPSPTAFDTVGWFARDAATMDKVAQSYGLGRGTDITRCFCPWTSGRCASAETMPRWRPLSPVSRRASAPRDPSASAPRGWPNGARFSVSARRPKSGRCMAIGSASTTPDFGPGIKRFEIASKITPEEAAAQAEKTRIAAHIRARCPRARSGPADQPGPGPVPVRPESALDGFRMAAFEMLCVAGLSGLPQLSIPGGHGRWRAGRA